MFVRQNRTPGGPVVEYAMHINGVPTFSLSLSGDTAEAFAEFDGFYVEATDQIAVVATVPEGGLLDGVRNTVVSLAYT
jgi:hypothetical protein